MLLKQAMEIQNEQELIVFNVKKNTIVTGEMGKI
jgi:hypothetical protein